MYVQVIFDYKLNPPLQVYHDTRGQELPGNYNSAFLTELFHEQSSRWPTIARKHILQLHGEICEFIQRTLAHEVKEDHVYQEMQKILSRSLRANLDAALAELQRLCDDEKMQPITYNHYYTDNIQKSRQDNARRAFEHALKCGLNEWSGSSDIKNAIRSNNSVLLASMQSRLIVDMDRQACEEAKTSLKAYYKVSHRCGHHSRGRILLS